MGAPAALPPDLDRLQWAIRAALSSPLLDDIQGFAWEAVFHAAKQLALRDPLAEGKTKRLFDAVDAASGKGWSLKAKQCGTPKSMRPGMVIEIVIQRADVFSKAVQLGYRRGLAKASPPATLGKAVVRLWNNKVREDIGAQCVRVPMLAVLLKSANRKRYGYFELPLEQFGEDQFDWAWAAGRRKGLQAREGGTLRLKWYPSGTQLFQCVTVPPTCVFFDVQPNRVPMDTYIAFIRGLAPR